jgi:hypothetical protein
MTTPRLIKSIGRSPSRRLFLIPLGLACFAISPTAHAVSPPPDGGYPGRNTAEGDGTLQSLTIGSDNTANGFGALGGNTTGSSNTAAGQGALGGNTTGSDNTANGVDALASNTTGNYNTATGVFALEFNTTGSSNTANGAVSLSNNTTGSSNTATGLGALNGNTTGNFNTANGFEALQNNTTGINNAADGANALFNNTTGEGNTANGFNALSNNTTAFNNTADGQSALSSNTTGNSNTAIGWSTLHGNTTGGSNIALGFNAGGNLTTGGNNIDIGNLGVAGEAKKIRIGTVGTQTATFVAGIVGVTVPSGVGVIVGSNGQLGTVVSSERFKDQVKPMDKASEAILALKPVTFRYKKDLDPDGIPQFGLVAEQVEKVNPDLVARDGDGKAYTVRYDAVNAMLLNEFLKEHCKVQELQATLAQQQKTFESKLAGEQKQIDALTKGLQKVSAQLEVSKPAPQTVLNSH